MDISCLFVDLTTERSNLFRLYHISFWIWWCLTFCDRFWTNKWKNCIYSLSAMRLIFQKMSLLFNATSSYEMTEVQLRHALQIIAFTSLWAFQLKWSAWNGSTNCDPAQKGFSRGSLRAEQWWSSHLISHIKGWQRMTTFVNVFRGHFCSILAGIILFDSEAVNILKTMLTFFEAIQPNFVFHFTERILKKLEQAQKLPIFSLKSVWIPANWTVALSTLLCYAFQRKRVFGMKSLTYLVQRFTFWRQLFCCIRYFG